MPAYLIALIDVKSTFGGRFLARGGRLEVPEGQPFAGRAVMVEFTALDRGEP